MFCLELLRESKSLLHCRARRAAQALLATTALSVIFPQIVAAQTPVAAVSNKRSYSIPRQSLDSALAAFSRVAGVQVLNRGTVTQGVTSPGVSGSLTPQEAVTRLLAGTGLAPRFTSANTVTVTGTAVSSNTAVVPGAIQLDTVDVSGGRVAAAEAPYQTPAPVAHISQETIDRFRGSSPADIFRGTPGVMSGEARNGAGSIDVNIRGMQGMGRVATTIDGAENGLAVYQGYQGISNRTFVDPDLIAGVDITKGSDVSSRGIAGTVAMRTLSADDVVKPGEKWGVWLKSGFGTNTATPRPGALGGYLWEQPTVGSPNLAPSSTSEGMSRPGFLNPTSGSGSVVAAWKDERFDLLAGYARRQQGNYFAGKNGPGAQPTGTGPRPFCYSSGVCLPLNNDASYTNFYENAGLTSYRKGEEVLNTQLDTQSWIAKATVRSDNGQSLQLGYNGFRSEAGDLLASRFAGAQSQATQQVQTTGTKVDSGTLRYRWNPADNDLIDLKANLWLTNVALRNPIRVGAASIKPEDFGLPHDYRTGSNSQMWGGDLANKSHLSFDQYGSLDLTYGMSYLNEATSPTPFSDKLNNFPSRIGNKEEVAGFGKAAYKPVEWLTLNGGLRYSHFWSQDKAVPDPARPILTNLKPLRDEGGFSPSAGVVVEPVKGAQFYVNYSNTLRMPSLFEAVSAFSNTANVNLRPERASNWEVGLNVIRDGIISSNDKAMFKFGYFNWNIKGYVARQWMPIPGPNGPVEDLVVHNIDRARFEGLEFSSRYENRGFTAELAANYYLNVEFCQTSGNCDNKTLTADYATNQIPPKYSANLTLSQKLFDDALTVGGRVSYVGPRAAGHSRPAGGAQTFIALIDWEPYWLTDVFAEYKLTKDITAWASIENLTDTYYVDPLSLVSQPGPGRTFRLGMTGKFGGEQPPSAASLGQLFGPANHVSDWTGFYAGAHAGYDFARFRGSTTALDGSIIGYPGRESPNIDVNGFSFGVHAGFNYQFSNRIIAGFEADLAKLQIGHAQVTYSNEGLPGNGPENLARNRQLESAQKGQVDWLSTVRGRLGYAINDKLMIYGTAGVAFMKQNEERTQYRAERTLPGAFSPIDRTVADFTEIASLTRTGYVVGGGAEYELGSGWSLKGEFLFARFGQKDVNFPNARAGVMPDKTETVVIDPGVPGGLDFTMPGCNWPADPFSCFNPGRPPVTENRLIPGSHSNSIGRKILSKIDIPMIKVGLTYRF